MQAHMMIHSKGPFTLTRASHMPPCGVRSGDHCKSGGQFLFDYFAPVFALYHFLVEKQVEMLLINLLNTHGYVCFLIVQPDKYSKMEVRKKQAVVPQRTGIGIHTGQTRRLRFVNCWVGDNITKRSGIFPLYA